MEATIAIPQPDLEYVSEEPQKEDASLGSKKRSFTEICEENKTIEEESVQKYARTMKTNDGKAMSLMPLHEIIIEKSEESSPESIKNTKKLLRYDNLKTNSCFMPRGQEFISLKSRVQNFFAKRSCEEHMNSARKDMTLTKPQSPNLHTRGRIRRECDQCLAEKEKKDKKSFSKPSFVFKKFDPNSVVSAENCFENGKFKARKIPNYKSMEIKKSEKDCVVPIGFKLQTQQRLGLKNKENLRESLPQSRSLDKTSMEKRHDFPHNEKKSFSRYSLILRSGQNHL